MPLMQLMILMARTCKVDEFVLNLPEIHVTDVVAAEETAGETAVEIEMEDALEAAGVAAETVDPVETLQVLIPNID
jgi:hypothetical protein